MTLYNPAENNLAPRAILNEKLATAALMDQFKADLRRAAKVNEQAVVPDGLPYALVDICVREFRAEQSRTGGNKHDSGKLPLHLLPVDALEAITEILDFGAKKYAPRNWEKGLDWSRVYRASIGHLFKWWAGAGLDEETGKSHLWHAGCCILFLIAYELRGVGKDDRPSNSA